MDGFKMDELENVEQNSQKCPICYLYLFAGVLTYRLTLSIFLSNDTKTLKK